MDDNANREAEKAVELAHPFGVALGEIIVDCDHVHTATAQCVQVDGKSCDQRFAFAGLHFGDGAAVQDHATYQLHIEVAHVEHTPSGFAHHREGFFQDFIQDLLQGVVLLFCASLNAFRILLVLGFRSSAFGWLGSVTPAKTAEVVLNAFAEFIGLGA